MHPARTISGRRSFFRTIETLRFSGSFLMIMSGFESAFNKSVPRIPEWLGWTVSSFWLEIVGRWAEALRKQNGSNREHRSEERLDSPNLTRSDKRKRTTQHSLAIEHNWQSCYFWTLSGHSNGLKIAESYRSARRHINRTQRPIGRPAQGNAQTLPSVCKLG